MKKILLVDDHSDIRRLIRITLGKNFDGTGGFGPDIVTSDELPPGGAPLRIMTRVNGKVMQDSNTDDLIFDVPTLVHELSKCMTLDPGDIIITASAGMPLF